MIPTFAPACTHGWPFPRNSPPPAPGSIFQIFRVAGLSPTRPRTGCPFVRPSRRTSPRDIPEARSSPTVERAKARSASADRWAASDHPGRCVIPCGRETSPIRRAPDAAPRARRGTSRRTRRAGGRMRRTVYRRIVRLQRPPSWCVTASGKYSGPIGRCSSPTEMARSEYSEYSTSVFIVVVPRGASGTPGPPPQVLISDRKHRP
jgi:hypothetical protein